MVTASCEKPKALELAVTLQNAKLLDELLDGCAKMPRGMARAATDARARSLERGLNILVEVNAENEELETTWLG